MKTDRFLPPEGASLLLHRELTGRLLKSFFDVYNELGTGFLEAVYVQAFANVLRGEHIPFEREVALTVRFRGDAVGVCKPDFIVAGAVVIECKAVSALDAVHRAQLLNYLRATGLEVGLLLNFGPVPQFKRFVQTHPARSRAT